MRECDHLSNPHHACQARRNSAHTQGQIGAERGESSPRFLGSSRPGADRMPGEMAAAEAQAEEPSPPPPPEKRAAPTDGEEGDGQEERPEPKRRRARVAALENVPRAAAAPAAAAAAASEEDDAGEPAGGCDGASFSFHARSFSGVETTPKFGSFNPAAADFVAFHLTPPPPLVDPAETEADDEAVGSPVVGGSDEEEEEQKGKDGNSH